MLRSQPATRSRIITMKTPAFSRILRAALSGAALSCVASVALADIRNYEFELVEPTVKAGADRTIAVKLVDKTTGKPVPDAVIFATRLDMAPDAMQEMVTKLTPLGGSEPGTYRFQATFGMEGRWQLSLAAKVQGETGTVENKLVIQADK
jgi:YtkA-like